MREKIQRAWYNISNSDAAQLRDILNLSIPHVRTHAVSSPIERRVADEDPLVGTNSRMLSIETIDSSSCRSSCDRLNSTWKDCKASCGRRYSLEEEDTSGIHTANEWSLETRSDARNTPMCLGDELAIASRECSVNLPNVCCLRSLVSHETKNRDEFGENNWRKV